MRLPGFPPAPAPPAAEAAAADEAAAMDAAAAAPTVDDSPDDWAPGVGVDAAE